MLSIWAAGGWQMVAAVMSILMAHEMGHYLACRYYRVDASLPYFIPFPIHFAGTLGAFIRIREPFPNRKVLFDVGIAGPFAGFLVCVPLLALGLSQSQVVPDVAGEFAYRFGQPLIYRWAKWAVLGPVPAGQIPLLSPVAVGAWFGLFVTALNMFPAGQLDGGHVSYAILRRRSGLVSKTAILASLALVFFRPTWVLWTVLLLLVGRRHPPTLDDAQPLGWPRVAVGILGFLMFAVCFTPEPFVISWSQYVELFGMIFT